MAEELDLNGETAPKKRKPRGGPTKMRGTDPGGLPTHAPVRLIRLDMKPGLRRQSQSIVCVSEVIQADWMAWICDEGREIGYYKLIDAAGNESQWQLTPALRKKFSDPDEVELQLETTQDDFERFDQFMERYESLKARLEDERAPNPPPPVVGKPVWAEVLATMAPALQQLLGLAVAHFMPTAPKPTPPTPPTPPTMPEGWSTVFGYAEKLGLTPGQVAEWLAASIAQGAQAAQDTAPE